MDDDNIKSVGFAIITTNEDMIEDNYRERFDEGDFDKPELSDSDWEKLNEDIGQIERNVLAYLSKTIENARDEGHNGNDGALTGTAWYDSDKKDQVDFVMSHSIDTDPNEIIWEPEFYKDVSEYGENLIDVTIEFFDIPEEDYEAWEDED